MSVDVLPTQDIDPAGDERDQALAERLNTLFRNGCATLHVGSVSLSSHEVTTEELRKLSDDDRAALRRLLHVQPVETPSPRVPKRPRTAENGWRVW